MRISIDNFMAFNLWRMLLVAIVVLIAFCQITWASEPLLDNPYVDEKTDIVFVPNCYVKSGDSKFYFLIGSKNVGYLYRGVGETYYGAAQVIFENGTYQLDLGHFSESENYRLAVDRFMSSHFLIVQKENLTFKVIAGFADKPCA